MIRNGIYTAVLLLGLFISTATVHAQYAEYSKREVDSLEQVLATNPPTGTALGNIYQDLMWAYRQTDSKKSMDYARKCIEMAIPLDGWNATSNGYLILGMNHYQYARYDSAVIYYNKALEATERMRDFPIYTEEQIDSRLSQIYGNMGNMYNMQGMLHETVEYYIKAMKIFEKQGSIRNLVYLNGNIGEMYLAMGNNEQAKGYFLAADSLAQVTNDSLMIAFAKHHLSGAFMKTQDYAAALENALKAYAYYAAHPEEASTQVAVLNTLVQIYLGGYDDVSQAETYINQSLSLAKTVQVDSVNQATSVSLLAEIYLRKGDWRRAEQTALQSLAIDDEEFTNTLPNYEVLAKAYAYMGDAAKSAEYFDKHDALLYSWSNKNYQSAIRDMEVKYETEKKETQISTLESEKRQMTWLSIAGGAVLLLALATIFFLWRWTVQKKRLAENQKELAEQQIGKLEQEKKLVATQAVLDGEIQERIRLARDLHDGLGSILTGVKLHLQEMKKEIGTGNAAAPDFDKALVLLDDSVREMRRVSHHLMPDALSRFGLKPAVDDFCRSISPRIVFDWFGNEKRLDVKLEELIYRCIHELVNNALKYADASQIMVQIMQEDDRIAFTVQDDGCGFDPSAVTQGMGLQNIRTRVTSFGGNIQIDSKAGEGTEVNVELRIE